MDTTVATTGIEVRRAARDQILHGPTSGLAAGYLQANLIVLPERFADDFRQLCARNPVPCPLLAESAAPGRWDAVVSRVPGLESHRMLSDIDIRRDAPRYLVLDDGQVVDESGSLDIMDRWQDDHVAFLIGCSFSFESALLLAGLNVRHVVMGRNVPMYKTKLPLCPAGIFTGASYVVSMRPFRAEDIDAVRAITRPYAATHGEPIAWGWGALDTLGIENIDSPTWGDAPLTEDGRPLGELQASGDEIPVFWGCGVTPIEAVRSAGLSGVVMSHSPGHMIVLDARDEDITQDLGCANAFTSRL
ncbi:DUF1445 domain-containing protein [Aaosphaeria arxii CBS 175.79]|uniref:DUF1445 domain-containing protein n=1 Tax=Aaosphaeria arxii CBS 175.79 TaxID=1450172 RepID=A0A6A5XCJ5_9PLEO|nr:DUF1445 domain-containing protein [Aaosphaeria arxii CBS 175.79]KAF2010640.1 DUF1445 domain-containing protein [Aaosphaeria arxii CBS 175.79]